MKKAFLLGLALLFSLSMSAQHFALGLTVTQLAFAFGGSNPSLPTNKKDSS